MVIFCLLIFISCEKNDQTTNEFELFEENLSAFKNNFPCEYENINYNYLQELNSDSLKSSDTIDEDGIIFPVMEDDKVVGRYIGLLNQLSAVYIDMTDYTNTITIYDVNNPDLSQKFDMIYNPEKDIYEPVVLKSATGFWCGVACGLGTVAIAATDGPSPLMDVLAASYAVSCLASCVA